MTTNRIPARSRRRSWTSGCSRSRRAADVFIRALALFRSLDELTDLRAFATAHYGGWLPEDLERAIAERRREIEGRRAAS